MSSPHLEARTFRLLVAYDGTGLAGWQRQKNTGATVQQILETALGSILPAGVSAIAAGRTDAGVHALAQAVHLRLESSAFAERSVSEVCRSLVLGTNAHLPDQVRVLRADRMPTGFHARKCALGKTYRFCWVRGDAPPPPQLGRYVVHIDDDEIDVCSMRRAAAFLVGSHDFSAFARSGGAHLQPVRTVERVELVERGPELTLEVSGNGFLRGMVRAIAGTLREVGLGKRSPEDVRDLLRGAQRSAAGPNAPAHGLTLVAVHYPARWAPLEPAQGFPQAD